MVPSLPSACPTAFQSSAPICCCPVLALPCGLEQATRASAVIKNVTVAATLNCLDLLMILSPFSSISFNPLARVPLLDRRGEDERSKYADDSGDDERHLRREFQQQSTDCR